jgi:uncharacterized protein (UPF0335 family)
MRSGTIGVEGGRLRSIVERIEHIEEEIRSMNDDKKDVYAEAKSAGFDVKIIREIVRLRREDPKDRDERGSLLDAYLHAIETAPVQEIHQEAA